MNPYITFRDKDKDGNLQYYILQRSHPNYVGVISSVPISGTWLAPVGGYNLWVVFSGTIQGNFLPSYQNVSAELQSVLDNMAAWFWAERIVISPKRFEKFKLKNDVQSTPQ